MDCFLALRGTKTLAVRMERHEANARVLAPFLAAQKSLKTVHYPGLVDHPHHQLARRQARGFGALIAFDLGTVERADTFLRAVKLFTLAESLGGVESLISHPASMTHGSVPPAERLKLGITPGLVRISVGIEDVEDLQADLASALATVA
jgi:cystathionine gamma-lyase/homocysteine desulfhydrase